MSFFKKWYIYQKERFPVVVYGLYIFCIVFATFCFGNYYGKEYFETLVFIVDTSPYKIEWIKMIPMFIVAFLQFLMVRIADEFKDYEEDCKYRPYRPVPRGLIKLSELKVLFILCAIIQVVLTLIFNKDGIILLLLLWTYLAFMSKDFFLGKVIDKHILFGVLLDELLMPILVLYLSSYIYIDYSSIWLLLVTSYIISWIVEIARKIRCKEDEEKGVKTYTAVFGIRKAIFILTILEALLMICKFIILARANFVIVEFIIFSIINLLFVIKKTKTMAKLTELSANIYIMLAYLSMGLLIL